MGEFFNSTLLWIKELVTDKDYVTLALVIIATLLLLVVFRLNIVFDFFQARKRSEIGLHEEARDNAPEGSSLRQHYQDEIENEYFRLTWKIRVSKPLRNAMIKFLENSDGRIRKVHLVRAYKLMNPDTNRIDIQLKLKHKIESWFFNLAGGLIMIFGMLPLLRGWVSYGDIKTTLIAYSFGLVCIVGGMFFASLAFPYSSAKKVLAEAERQKELSESE